MPIDRKRLLELAIARLEDERARVEQEIEKIQAERKGASGRGSRMRKPAQRKPGRRKMTASQRKEVSERMKSYWSDRKKAEKESAKTS